MGGFQKTRYTLLTLTRAHMIFGTAHDFFWALYSMMVLLVALVTVCRRDSLTCPEARVAVGHCSLSIAKQGLPYVCMRARCPVLKHLSCLSRKLAPFLTPEEVGQGLTGLMCTGGSRLWEDTTPSAPQTMASHCARQLQSLAIAQQTRCV